MNKGTFPDEERKQWVAKCPKCGEEFLRYKGGPQCQLGKCSDLDLQNEHEEILPLMVTCALPQYKGYINASVPKDWHAFGKRIDDGNMGLSDPFATPPWLKVPWYACRIKGTFFNTTCHELGHINSIHAKDKRESIKFGPSMRKVLRKWSYVSEIGNSKLKKFVNNPKYRVKTQNYLSEFNKSREGHWEDIWQNEYVRIHGTLMGSRFAKYNYYKKPTELIRIKINKNFLIISLIQTPPKLLNILI